MVPCVRSNLHVVRGSSCRDRALSKASGHLPKKDWRRDAEAPAEAKLRARRLKRGRISERFASGRSSYQTLLYTLTSGCATACS